MQHELASCTAIAGSLPIQIPTDRGILEVEQLEPRIQPDIYYCAHTRMIAVENTHNAAGGTFYPLATLKKIGVFARRRKLSVHMDGARLFNASVASGDPVKSHLRGDRHRDLLHLQGPRRARGGVLCGTKEFIAEARRVRKLLGGGMRQAGIIAAAGIYALSNNVERLAEDHENAKTLAQRACVHLMGGPRAGGSRHQHHLFQDAGQERGRGGPRAGAEGNPERRRGRGRHTVRHPP